MKHCLLIADDLTGACDAAVQFAMRGWRAVVSLGPDGGEDADVLAVSTETREAGADEFRPRLPFFPARILFKKIDSLLRGHAAGEIRVLAELLECDAAVITPAFPAMRRIVEDGVLRVEGIAGFEPIGLTEYFRYDGCVHARPAGVRETLAGGARFVTVDAVCDRDLDEIVCAGMNSRRRILWAGSAGLAAALARFAAGGAARAELPARPEQPPLFCIGSEYPVTVEQLARLRAEREAAVLEIPWRRVTPARLQGLLLAARRTIGALVISGGETASLVCRALGVREIELCDEIAPGIPRGILRGGEFDGVPVATKSGAFGDSDALIRIHDSFLCHKS